MSRLSIKIPEYIVCDRTIEKDKKSGNGSIIMKSYTSMDGIYEMCIYQTNDNSKQYGSMQYIFSSKEENKHVFQSTTNCNRIYTKVIPKDEPIIIQNQFGDTYIIIPHKDKLLVL